MPLASKQIKQRHNKESKKAIEWFREYSATFAHVAFRGESKYNETFCKPNK